MTRAHPLAATPDHPVVVVGASLAGLATSVRLARVGHHVVVIDRDPRPRTDPWSRSPVVDLPAAWRDLFRKSGRILDAALALEGYELVAAPPTRHVFSDSSTVDLPTDRGPQHAALASVVGARAADAWRDLVDDADDTWQLVRRAGLEAEADLSSPLFADPRTVETEARRMPDERVAELVRSVAWRLGSDPAETPYWLLSRLSVERLFGRWVVIREGVPQPAEVLYGLLLRRAADRGVDVRWGVTATALHHSGLVTDGGDLDAAAVVSAVGYADHAALRGRPEATVALPRRLGPLRLGTRRLAVEPPRSTAADGPATDGPLELVQHAASGTTTTWTLPGRTVVSTGAPDDGGLRWRGPATARAFHPLADQEVWYAGSGSVGGAEPWARLLTGALATYRVHEQLTGDDIRPSNKAYRP